MEKGAGSPPSSDAEVEYSLPPLELSEIRNLVLQGGSVKGTAYGGAIGGLAAAFHKAGNFLRITN
jgi:hypothetical protein